MKKNNNRKYLVKSLIESSCKINKSHFVNNLILMNQQAHLANI